MVGLNVREACHHTPRSIPPFTGREAVGARGCGRRSRSAARSLHSPGVVVGALVWEYETGPGIWTAGLPHPAGCLTLAGRTHALTGAIRVRLWNPARATPAQVAEARSFLGAREVHQSYDQTSHTA